METTSNTPPPVVNPPPGEDKTVAILSYLTLIGLIAAIIIHSNKKTALGAFHLRQMLGFFLTCLAVSVGAFILVLIPFLGPFCLFIIWASMFVLWILGLIAAINGNMTPMPVVGPAYQKMFSNTF